MMALIESAISLPDRYILSLSKNENKFNEKDKTKQKWKIHSRKASMVLTVKAVLWLISSVKNIWPTSVSQNRHEVSKNSCSLRFSAFMHEKNHLRFSGSKHFRFYWTKKHFISEWYFTKNHETMMKLGVLSWEKLKHRETHSNGIVSLERLRLRVEEQLLIFSSCLSQSWP